MKISNAPEKFFETQAHFDNFIESWKVFHKDGKHKKVDYTTWNGDVIRISNLECVHHYIYNLFRGKDIDTMFTMTKKYAGQNYYYAFERVKDELYWSLKRLTDRQLKHIMEPFNGSVTRDMIQSLVNDTESWSM